jgi:hypothetical protein
MPLSARLSVHKNEKQEQSSENHTTSQHLEATDGAPPDYAAPAALDTDSADVLNAAFANLKISEQENLPFPDVNLCLAHLKLLTVFHNLKEEIGYTDGLFDLWDSRCDIAGENRGEALVKTREKRWALYIARAVERFQEWWLKVLCRQEESTRLQQKDMLSANHKFRDFPKRGVARRWDTAGLPPIGMNNYSQMTRNDLLTQTKMYL